MTDQPTAPYIIPAYVGPQQPPRREQDPLVGWLLSALLLAPVIALDFGVVWWQWEHSAGVNDWLRMAISMVPPLLYAVVVLIRGRQILRGLLAAPIAVAAAVSGALLTALLNLQNDEIIDPLRTGQIIWIADVTAYLTAGLTVLAWGVACRRGLLWLAGLLSVWPLVWFAAKYVDHLFKHVDQVSVGLGLKTSAVYFAATLAAGIVCWLLDLLQRLIWPASAPVSTA